MNDIKHNELSVEELMAESLWKFDFEIIDSFGATEERKKILDECLAQACSGDILPPVISNMKEKEGAIFKELLLNCIELAFDTCASIELCFNPLKKAVNISLVSSFIVLDKKKMDTMKKIFDRASQVEIISLSPKNLDLQLSVKYFFGE